MVRSTQEAVRAVEEKLLIENPFPEAVTGQNIAFTACVTDWAEDARQSVVRDATRLRSKPGGKEPEAWELAALQRAVHEWRIFETFRRLHEERWCPGRLFRLHTKTDLLILCDADADSSKDGFGERQRRLAKRGLAGRLEWAEARRLVAALGLLEETASSTPPQGEGACTTPASELLPRLRSAEGGDAEGAREHVEVVPVRLSDVRLSREDAGRGDSSTDGAGPGDSLPPLLLDRVWSLLPTYTKKQLEAVCARFGVGLWGQFGDRFYASMRKPEMRAYTRRVVRHHACLDAAHRLSGHQLDALYDWMQANLTEPSKQSDDRSDPDLRIAARLFDDFQAMAALSVDGYGLSPVARDRYRDGELRRIAAFCYHHFYEASAARSGEVA